jgi:hypothetical protein
MDSYLVSTFRDQSIIWKKRGRRWIFMASKDDDGQWHQETPPHGHGVTKSFIAEGGWKVKKISKKDLFVALL